MRKIYTMLLLITSFITTNTTYAQEYIEQISAFEKSFEDKNAEKLIPFLNSEFTIPTSKSSEQTERGLNQLFKQLSLISLEVKEVIENSVLISYTFDRLGERTSSIQFNDTGKITKIELFDNLINETIERRSAKPMPDEELSKKYPSKKVTFKVQNKRTVYGELYEVGKDQPVILLCHQSGFNKYEYVDIAPKLNALGFNCLAVDLTSGGTFQEKKNETIENTTPPIDRNEMAHIAAAEEEIAAAISYLYEKYKKRITIWGSSNSATLGLLAASKYKNINAAIAFSGFDHFRENRTSLSVIIPKIEKPLFMSSAKVEASIITGLLEGVQLRKNQIHFTPNGIGDHGSKALWNGRTDADEYWVAIKSFLKSLKKV